MHGDEKTFIRTYTGGQVWPLDPRPEDVRLVDIAHSLGMQCRFTGHPKFRYSIGEHVVRGTRWILDNPHPSDTPEWNRKLALHFLHHDDEETYMNDLSRPVKHDRDLVGYRAACAENEFTIHNALGLDYEWASLHHDDVKEIDNRMLSTEQSQLMKGPLSIPEAEPLPIRLTGWSPARAKFEYLYLHHRLSGMGIWDTIKTVWKEMRQ